MIKSTDFDFFFHNRDWRGSLLANFLGALLGIIVTFGTSSYIEYRQKKEMARKVLLITLSNIDRSINNVQDMCNDMHKIDSCFTLVIKHYPDRLEELPDSILDDFVFQFTVNRVYPMDTSAERIFTQNMDVWRIIDNILLQKCIGDCFADCNTFFQIQQEWNDRRQPLAWTMLALKYETDRLDVTTVRKMLDNPDIRTFMHRHRYYTSYMSSALPYMKEESRRVKEQAGVTQEELEEFLAIDSENLSL